MQVLFIYLFIMICSLYLQLHTNNFWYPLFPLPSKLYNLIFSRARWLSLSGYPTRKRTSRLENVLWWASAWDDTKLELPTMMYCRICGDMIEVYKMISHRYDQETNIEFCIRDEPTRGNTVNIFKSNFRTKVQQQWFLMRMIDVWNSLPSNVVHAGNVNAFERSLDKFWEVLHTHVDMWKGSCISVHTIRKLRWLRSGYSLIWPVSRNSVMLRKVRIVCSPWSEGSRAGLVIVSHYLPQRSSELINTNLQVWLTPLIYYTPSSPCSRETVTTPCQWKNKSP